MGKKGRLYIRFIIAVAIVAAVALLAAAIYAYSAFAVLKVNNMFRWFNRSELSREGLTGYWKLDGNAIGDDKEIA